MPRPRFSKLPAEKRQQIFETAAKEFAQYGYEDASFNRILEAVGMSKGAAYYYFDDKADLFATVIGHYADEVMGITQIKPGDFTAETFWPELIELYAHPAMRFYDTPWLMGLFRSLNGLSEPMREQEAVKMYTDRIWSWFLLLVKRGQELGVVRTDLPDELLYALVAGLDAASDQWIAEHWMELTPEQAQDYLRRIARALQRVMSPEV